MLDCLKQEIQEWKRQELLKFYTIYKNSHKRFLELPRPKKKEEQEEEEIKETIRKKKEKSSKLDIGIYNDIFKYSFTHDPGFLSPP